MIQIIRGVWPYVPTHSRGYDRGLVNGYVFEGRTPLPVGARSLRGGVVLILPGIHAGHDCVFTGNRRTEFITLITGVPASDAVIT